MKKGTSGFRLVSVIAVFLFALSASAQTNVWDKAWTHTPPATGATVGGQIAHDRAGNVYVLGAFNNNVGVDLESSMLLKYSASGALIWKRDFMAYGERYTGAASLAIDEQDRIYVCGAFGGTGYSYQIQPTMNFTLLADTVVATTGGSDAFLMRLDTTGKSVWLKTYGGAGREAFTGLCAKNNRVFLMGEYADTMRLDTNVVFHTPNNNFQKSFFALLDTNGKPVWANSGSRAERLNAIALDTRGNAYLLGTSGGSFYFDGVLVEDLSAGAVSGAGFVAKFDTAGKCQWATSQSGFLGASGCGVGGFVEPLKMVVHPNGDLSVCGTYNFCALNFGKTGNVRLPLAYENTPYLVRYGANGNPLWVKGGNPESSIDGSGIATDAQSNVYFMGTMVLPGIFGKDSLSGSWGRSDAFFLKYNPAGKLLWKRTAGGDLGDLGYDITLSPDESSVYCTGFTNSKNTMHFGELTIATHGKGSLFVGKASTEPMGISQAVKSDFTFAVFPNPATTALNLRLPAGTAVQEAALYNTLGSLVFQWSGLASKAEMSLPLPGVAAGTYTLLLRSAAGGQSHCKVVVNP